MVSSRLLPYRYSKFVSSEIFTLLAGPSLKPFRIHKQLLAEVSAELKGHVYNEMKEGLEGSMEMPHVSEETMCQFLEFCYTGDYLDDIEDEGEKDDKFEDTEEEEKHDTQKIRDEHEKSSNKLHVNAKIYVLGDMYNIPRLKDIAFGNITAVISEIGYVTPDHDNLVVAYINLFRYTFENLPEHDPLLEYLGKFAAWNLSSFRENQEFIILFSESDNVEFTRLVLRYVIESEYPPWVRDASDTKLHPQTSKPCVQATPARAPAPPAPRTRDDPPPPARDDSPLLTWDDPPSPARPPPRRAQPPPPQPPPAGAGFDDLWM